MGVVMRADMSKVIVERPRIGGGASFPRARDRVRDFDLLPKREAIKRPWSGDSKLLNENLAPLKRYLRSNVGRPWNKVFSEISQHINVNSAVQLHIRQHLDHYVTLDASKVEKIWVNTRGEPVWSPFVVNARTGLLVEVRQRRPWFKWWRQNMERRRQREEILCDKKRGFAYRKIDGIWYRINFASIPAAGESFFDVLLRRPLIAGRSECSPEHKLGIYASKKTQLNSKDIRQEGLKES